MCVSVKAPAPPPAPEPIPATPPSVSNATTQQSAPTSATSALSPMATSPKKNRMIAFEGRSCSRGVCVRS